MSVPHTTTYHITTRTHTTHHALRVGEIVLHTRTLLSLSLVLFLSRVPFPVTCGTPRPRGEDAWLGGAGPEKGILGEEGGEEAEGEGKVEVATGHDRFSVGNPMIGGEEEPGRRQEGSTGEGREDARGEREGEGEEENG